METLNIPNNLQVVQYPTSYLSTQPKSLNELVELLHQVFASDKVNIDYVKAILKNYKGTPKEWTPFIKFSPDRYTRNLVDAGNGKFNLMVLCWAESQGSSIHDHTNSHCFVKCLQGKIVETRYAWPTDEQNEPMNVLSRNELAKGEVTYINDSLGLHRVENPSHTEGAVTLHLYVPPFDHCRVFNENTSSINEIKMSFYSIAGAKITKD